MALPVVLALYELLYERRRSWRTLIAMGAIAAAFVAFRTGALTENELYRPLFHLVAVHANPTPIF